MSLKSQQPYTTTVTASGLTAATTAYAAGDMLGAEITVPNAALVAGDGGVITGIQVVDSAKVIGPIDLRFFNAASSPASDNAANSWSDANARLQEIAYQMPAPVASALNAQWYAGNLYLPYDTNADTNLYLNVITLAAHTFFAASTDLQFKIKMLRWV